MCELITVKYSDFIDGITAQADLDSIRAIIETGYGYCSDSVLAVLGIQVKKDNGGQDAGTN